VAVNRGYKNHNRGFNRAMGQILKQKESVKYARVPEWENETNFQNEKFTETQVHTSMLKSNFKLVS
jgi:hypothetical protein